MNVNKKLWALLDPTGKEIVGVDWPIVFSNRRHVGWEHSSIIRAVKHPLSGGKYGSHDLAFWKACPTREIFIQVLDPKPNSPKRHDSTH